MIVFVHQRLFIAVILVTLCLVTLCNVTAQAREIALVWDPAQVFDFGPLPLELWYGSELELIRASQLELTSTHPLITESGRTVSTSLKDQTLKTNASPQNVSQGASTDSALSEQNSSVTSLAFKESSTIESSRGSPIPGDLSLAFADSLDFDLWRLVKWTVVIMIVAGIATYCLRFHLRHLPMQQQSFEFKRTESLKLDPRTTLHIVMFSGERYLIATDLTGVKSVTRVPNWNLELSQVGSEDQMLMEEQILPSHLLPGAN